MAVVTSKNEINKLVKKFVGQGVALELNIHEEQDTAPPELDLYQPEGGMAIETMLKIDAEGVAYISMNVVFDGDFDANALIILRSLKFYRHSKKSLRANYEGIMTIQTDQGEFKLFKVIMKSKKSNNDGRLEQTETLTWRNTENGEKIKTIWGWRKYIDGR